MPERCHTPTTSAPSADRPQLPSAPRFPPGPSGVKADAPSDELKRDAVLQRRYLSICRNFGRKVMRSVRILLAGLAATVLIGATASHAQQPVKIRVSWVAPVSNWASILLEKKDLAKTLGQELRVRGRALRRHAADDHGARQQRAGGGQSRLLHARHRDPERRHDDLR